MGVDLLDVLVVQAAPQPSAGADPERVAHLDSGVVAVRDSKNPAGPALVFTPAEWDAS